MITISNTAKIALKTIIKQDGKSAYLYLKGGGCSGFNYKFKILQEDKKPYKHDDFIKIDDYNLYLCSKSIIFMIGTHIDYKQDIMGSRFDFSNDNIINKCGCGTSVNFKPPHDDFF
tara:strand:+ start:219 stop:566 length:348 start_codon:yes stop_codon:yes gene_type:complete